MSAPDLALCPVNIDTAKAFVGTYHSHHGPPKGWKFGVGVMTTQDETLRGTAIVGRPVNRHLDDGWTAEVTRCCTDGTQNVASKLYGACWRAARAMGYAKLITYTLEEEEGTSLRATEFEVVAETKGGGWDRPGRPREDTHPTQAKLRWEWDPDPEEILEGFA